MNMKPIMRTLGHAPHPLPRRLGEPELHRDRFSYLLSFPLVEQNILAPTPIRRKSECRGLSR